VARVNSILQGFYLKPRARVEATVRFFGFYTNKKTKKTKKTIICSKSPISSVAESSGFASCSICLRNLNPQPWRFSNNSIGLPPAHSLYICLFYESVSCVCALFSTCLSYLCLVRCVFRVLFNNHNHTFLI